MLRKIDLKNGTAPDNLHPLVLQYLNTIGFKLSDSAITLKVVEDIMNKHGLAFDATTLPANLKDKVCLDFSNLAEYLLANHYGYCFHHNIVAFECLKQLGFNVELMAANIRKPPAFTEANPLATHVIILLTFKNKRYLLDAGWGIAALKPLLIDTKGTQQSGYHVAKLSENKYGLIDNINNVRYEFNCTPVNIKDFESALNNVMSANHVFFNMFFYQQKKVSGQIHCLFNKRFTCLDAKGNTISEFTFGQPAKNILQTKFSLPADQVARLTQGSYPNKAIRKTITEFELPKKAYASIYAFLSKDEKQTAQQVSHTWKENRVSLTKK